MLARTGFADQGRGPVFAEPVHVDSRRDVADAVVELFHALLLGSRASSPPLLPDVDPTPWRGVGPYGQGGKGMTGGVPYGRPLAGLADDRDGLKLDRLELRLGPFLPVFPPGFVLDVNLQGDVVQEASVADNPFTRVELRPSGGGSVFLRALTEPVPVRELELSRAAHHLESTGDVLASRGLRALAERAYRMAANTETTTPEDVDALTRLLERSRTLEWATRGVGLVAPDEILGRGLGPTARAAGLAEDHRLEQDEYRSLHFEATLESGGDALARWRQRLREASASLRLARLPGATHPTGGCGRVEAPWGTISSTHSPMPVLIELLPSLLAGAEWGDAVTTIVGLCIDLEESARV